MPDAKHERLIARHRKCAAQRIAPRSAANADKPTFHDINPATLRADPSGADPTPREERSLSVSLSRFARLALALWVACIVAMAPGGAQAQSKTKSKSKSKTAALPALTIESSLQGSIARPGSSVTVRVRLDPSVKASKVSLLIGTWNELISYVDDTPPYVFPVQVERDWSGPMTFMVSAQSARGTSIGSGELRVNVVPSELPVAIAVTDPVRMVARRRSKGPQEQINVRGTYADGIVRDVGRAELGTSFHSSDERVVAVNSEGFLSAGTPGNAVVTVKNGALSAQVPVTIEAARGSSPASSMRVAKSK